MAHMDKMFKRAIYFNRDVSKWDVSSMTNMNSKNCTAEFKMKNLSLSAGGIKCKRNPTETLTHSTTAMP